MPVTSKVLKAMHVTDDVGRGVVRISIGLSSPLSYYDDLFIGLSKAYTKLQKVNSF
jgi:cysteine desulfurase